MKAIIFIEFPETMTDREMHLVNKTLKEKLTQPGALDAPIVLRGGTAKCFHVPDDVAITAIHDEDLHGWREFFANHNIPFIEIRDGTKPDFSEMAQRADAAMKAEVDRLAAEMNDRFINGDNA